MDAIFLHSGWRTAGTLFWHHLRANQSCKTFYEPLHESLANIDLAAISATGPANWNSRHPLGKRGYFEEYAPLLDPERQRGIRGSLTRFAFDDFFRPESAPDAELGSYIKGLCDLARQEGCLPVLKFTRSLGRLPWFRAHFPQAVHPVIIRDPWAQFRSAWRARTENHNGYFLAVPFLIIERNSEVADVAALMAALDLPVRPNFGGDPLARLEFWRVAVQRMPLDMLYRASFALWLLTYAKALPAASFVLDVAAPFAGLQAVFARHTGIELNLGASSVPSAQPLRLYRAQACTAMEDIRRAHDVALAVLAPLSDAKAVKMLAPCIDRAVASAARDLAGTVAELPRRSVPQSTALLLNTACRWLKSHPRLSMTG